MSITIDVSEGLVSSRIQDAIWRLCGYETELANRNMRRQAKLALGLKDGDGSMDPDMINAGDLVQHMDEEPLSVQRKDPTFPGLAAYEVEVVHGNGCYTTCVGEYLDWPYPAEAIIVEDPRS